MFFSKKYKIVVTNPCQESWEKMMPIDKGRFCHSCSKSVVDFTNLSDKEINEIVRNAGSYMCGKFSKDQLDKTFTMRPKIQLSAQRQFFQYILTFLLGSKAFINKAMGQDTLKTEQTDSLKSTAIADSTIIDTVALAMEDTANLQVDSKCVTYKSPEIIYTDNIEWKTTIAGGFSMPTVESTYPWLPQSDIFPWLPAAVDSIKKLVGITPSNKKEITMEEDTTPKKQRPRPPAKKEEPIVAVLPNEIKSEWDESKAE